MTMRERVGNATVEMSKTAMTTIRVRSRAAAGGFDGSGHHLSLGDEKEGLKKKRGGHRCCERCAMALGRLNFW